MADEPLKFNSLPIPETQQLARYACAIGCLVFSFLVEADRFTLDNRPWMHVAVWFGLAWSIAGLWRPRYKFACGVYLVALCFSLSNARDLMRWDYPGSESRSMIDYVKESLDTLRTHSH